MRIINTIINGLMMIGTMFLTLAAMRGTNVDISGATPITHNKVQLISFFFFIIIGTINWLMWMAREMKNNEIETNEIKK